MLVRSRFAAATHEAHRGLVEGTGLGFYPLAGDPKLLDYLEDAVLPQTGTIPDYIVAPRLHGTNSLSP